MRLAVRLCVAALLCGVARPAEVGGPGEAEARLFAKEGLFVRGVEQTKLTIQTVPSSCVVVEPSLPPCRGLRGMKLEPSPTTRVEMTEAPRVLTWQGMNSDHKVQQSPSLLPSKADIANVLSRWGSYLGLPPLVTTSLHEASMTRRVYDPSVMITFSVVGCRPTRLPFELPQCPKDGPVISVHEPQGLEMDVPSVTEVIVESSD